MKIFDLSSGFKGLIELLFHGNFSFETAGKDIDGILMRNPEAMLSDVAFETLKIYLQVTSSKDWFFPGQKVDSHITTRTEQKIFDDAIKKAKFIMIEILS